MLERLSLVYSGVIAVEDFSLSVGAGEFVTLLGPSGSGKTSVLRVIGGYVRPRTGRITLDGRDVTTMAPQRRNVGMVFQNYALFPHMSVADNVAFGLRARHLPRDEISRTVAQALELVQLVGFERRYPSQLSGGQQQRVALARAIAIRPALLLMDEPLAALDLRLREALQLDIRRIQRALGIATLYVTHDQGEAFTMSHRVVVMDHGRVVCVGTPEELLLRPTSVFAARFIGSSNVLPVDLRSWSGESGVVEIRGSEGQFVVSGPPPSGSHDPLFISVRPDQIAVGSEPGPHSVKGTVEGRRFVGPSVYLTVKAGTALITVLDVSRRAREGATVHLTWDPAAAVLLADTSA